jgi:small-conductance mechanosensitive channel
MSNFGRLLDGGRFLTASPYRSGVFVFVTLETLATVVIYAYLLYRYWNLLATFPTFLVSLLVVVQSIYRWLSAQRYYTRIRKIYAKRSVDGAIPDSPPDLALRTAIGGMTNILSYSSFITLLALILVGLILGTTSKIDPGH